MSEILKKLKKANSPVAVHYKTGGSFCTGYVKETDDEFVFMQFISPNGRFDGWHCIRIEEILKVDFGSNYLLNLEKVYRYYGDVPAEFKMPSKNVLQAFIDFAIKNKWLCSLEIGFESIEKICGYIRLRDWDTVEMQLLDENGMEDGYTSFDLEEVVYIGALSECETYLEILSSIHRGNAPEPPRREEGISEKGVLSFPFGKR